jgi:hypothetical protein
MLRGRWDFRDRGRGKEYEGEGGGGTDCWGENGGRRLYREKVDARLRGSAEARGKNRKIVDEGREGKAN